MKKFISGQLEVAEVELVSAGLPVTQAGADEFAKRVWKGSKQARRSRQLDACYRRTK